MISYKEAVEEVGKVNWPNGLNWYLSKDMMYLTVRLAELRTLNSIGLTLFEDAVNKSMAYLRAVNPAVTFRVEP